MQICYVLTFVLYLCRILGDKLDGRTISPVKISDYRMLQIEEFVNDIIIEFYLR